MLGKSKIVVILGQTATGKSALAVKLARKVNGEIISADSRQVYRGLDVGTGKITKKEMQGVPHHLLDVVDPKKRFTVAEYQKLATSAMADILKRGKIPIICGGTGLYIDALTKGLAFPPVPPDEKLRKQFAPKSAVALFRTLEKLDKRRARDIKNKNERNNKIRLIRAIEIARSLGRVPKPGNVANLAIAKNTTKLEFVKIGLYLPKEKLKEKIERRVRKMFDPPSVNSGGDVGLLSEIKKLKKTGVSENRLKELGFEYYRPTYEKVVSETLKYAKRQMTWFKRDKEIRWFDASKRINLRKIIGGR